MRRIPGDSDAAFIELWDGVVAEVIDCPLCLLVLYAFNRRACTCTYHCQLRIGQFQQIHHVRPVACKVAQCFIPGPGTSQSWIISPFVRRSMESHNVQRFPLIDRECQHVVIRAHLHQHHQHHPLDHGKINVHACTNSTPTPPQSPQSPSPSAPIPDTHTCA